MRIIEGGTAEDGQVVRQAGMGDRVPGRGMPVLAGQLPQVWHAVGEDLARVVVLLHDHENLLHPRGRSPRGPQKQGRGQKPTRRRTSGPGWPPVRTGRSPCCSSRRGNSPAQSRAAGRANGPGGSLACEVTAVLLEGVVPAWPVSVTAEWGSATCPTIALSTGMPVPPGKLKEEKCTGAEIEGNSQVNGGDNWSRCGRA